jgi:hypothetical protein
MIVVAWVSAVAFLVALLVALNVGVGCATQVGPFLAAGFFVSCLFLAYHYERRQP